MPIGAYKTTYLPPGPRVYPGPEAVRKEMELFKADFNARFKQVAFNSLCCAYYSPFIPCAFATVSYPSFVTTRHRQGYFLVKWKKKLKFRVLDLAAQRFVDVLSAGTDVEKNEF